MVSQGKQVIEFAETVEFQLFLLDNGSWRTFYILKTIMAFYCYLFRCGSVKVLTASNNDAKIVDWTQTVLSARLKSPSRFDRINNLSAISRTSKFYHLFAPYNKRVVDLYLPASLETRRELEPIFLFAIIKLKYKTIRTTQSGEYAFT